MAEVCGIGNREIEEDGFKAMLLLVNEALRSATDALEGRVENFKKWKQVGTKFEVMDGVKAMGEEYKKLAKATPRVTPLVAAEALLLFLEP